MTIFSKKQLTKNPNDYNYHLTIKIDDIGDIVILVGDPNRVKEVSKNFDKIYSKTNNREFVTHYGSINNKKISVISTGIGIDNMEIAINEINAIVGNNKKIKFIRIGTSGAIRKNIKLGSCIMSRYCLGLDSLIYYYKNYKKAINLEQSENIKNYYQFDKNLPSPYITNCSSNLAEKFKKFDTGITWTTLGFYGPQFRANNFLVNNIKMFNKIKSFQIEDYKIMNFEMESSTLYFLANLFGHEAITICSILANRANNEYHHQPKKAINNLIKKVLEEI